MNRAVFLDRDGTLNVERHYLHDPDQLEIIPGSGLALRRLMDAGYRLFIVTNQSGIGRGYYTEADMHAVNDKLSAELAASDGVAFEKIYFANNTMSFQTLVDGGEVSNIEMFHDSIFIDIPNGLSAYQVQIN